MEFFEKYEVNADVHVYDILLQVNGIVYLYLGQVLWSWQSTASSLQG